MDRWIVSSVALTNHKSQITAVLHVSSQKMGRPQRQVATVYAMMKGSYYCLQPTPEYEPRRQSNGKSIKKMVATAVLHVTRDMFFLPTTTAQRSGSRLCRESATRYQAPGIYGIARDIATGHIYSRPQKRHEVPGTRYIWDRSRYRHKTKLLVSAKAESTCTPGVIYLVPLGRQMASHEQPHTRDHDTRVRYVRTRAYCLYLCRAGQRTARHNLEPPRLSRISAKRLPSRRWSAASWRCVLRSLSACYSKIPTCYQLSARLLKISYVYIQPLNVITVRLPYEY